MEVQLSELLDLGEAWAAAGLDPGPLDDAYGPAVDRYRALQSERRDFMAAAEATDNQIVARLTGGELTLAEAVAQRQAAGTYKSGREAGRILFDKATRRLRSDAQTALRRIGAELAATLAAAHDQAVTDLAELLPKVDGIDNDAAAITATPKVREAWARATTLAEQVDRYRDLHRQLTTVGAIAAAPADAEVHAEFYARPDQLPAARFVADLHPARRLAAQLPATPRLATGDQLAAEQRRVEPEPEDIDDDQTDNDQQPAIAAG